MEERENALNENQGVLEEIQIMTEPSVYGKGELSIRGISGPPRRRKIKTIKMGSIYKRLQSKKRKKTRAGWMGWQRKGKKK